MSTNLTSAQESMDDLDVVTRDEVLKNKADILQSRTPLWRMKKDGKLVILPLEKLDQYLGDKSSAELKLFMEKEWIKRIRDESTVVKRTQKPTPAGEPAVPAQNEASEIVDEDETDHVFYEELNRFQGMSFGEREDILDENIEKIRNQSKAEGKLDLGAITEIVDVVTKTIYVNKTSIDDNIHNKDLENNLKGVLSKTNWLISSMSELLSSDFVSYHDFNHLEAISTGSSTVDHMNKVLLRFMPFCLFYNEYFGKGLIKKIRAKFKTRYYRSYKKLLPDEDTITLETVFKNGIRRIKDEELRDYSFGALLHDIGKMPDIQYHDSSAAFDKRKVIQHAPISYNMIIKAKIPWNIAAIAGLHHEYYGDPSGYNVSKALFAHFKKYSKYQDSKQFVISFNPEDIKSGLVWAYFPCKMLEIIDVFDALTDKSKKYRAKAHSIEEALVIMKEEFVDNKLKIDPILFDIFIEFVKEYAVLENPVLLDKLLK